MIYRNPKSFPSFLFLVTTFIFLLAGSLLFTGGVLMADDDDDGGGVISMYKEDFNGDGKVDFVDFAWFAESWLECVPGTGACGGNQ